jgi:hypothetical protein
VTSVESSRGRDQADIDARRAGARSRELLLIVGTVCAVTLWFTYAYMMWTPGILDRAGAVKGWDFSQFYALGWLGRTNQRGDLANGAAIKRAAIEIVSPTHASSTFVPVYGPQVALAFSPSASLSYLWALGCWLGLSLIIYFGCCVALWRSCRSLHRDALLAAILAAGSPVLFFLVCYAQLSAVALGLFTLAYFALQRDRPLLAGLAIGSLIYKPPLGLAAGLIFLVAGEWRIVAGVAVSALAQLIVAWSYAGAVVVRAYVHTLLHLNDNIALVQEKRHLLQSLASFFDLLLPWPRIAVTLYVGLSAAFLVAAWRVWTGSAPLQLRYSMMLLTTVLISPHFYIYDLIILVPAGFFLTDWLLRAPDLPRRTTIATCLVVLYVAPLAGAALAKLAHFQPMTPILCLLAALIARHSPGYAHGGGLVSRT